MNRLKGRSTSSAMTHIGFRFTPADEDIEELSFEVGPSSGAACKDSSSKKMPEPSFSSHKLAPQTEKKSTSEEKFSSEETGEPNAAQSKEGNVTDHPKDDSEKWKVFNELKGKITKTLEDRIHKDHIVVGVAVEKNANKAVDSEDSKRSSVSDKDEKLDLESNVHSSEKNSQCDESDSNHLSPSVEATEFIDQFLFDYDVNSESEKSKCVITSLPEKPQKPFSTITSNAQSLLNQKKQKSLGKSNISMSFSTLIATRSQSTEEEYIETSEQVEDEGLASSAESAGETKDVSNPVDVVMESGPENWLCDAKSRLRNHFEHLKTWNNTGLAFLVAFLSCIFAPLPSYLSGFLLGTFLSSCIFGLFWWLMKPTKQREPFILPDFNNVPLLAVTEKTEEHIYKGWMNELQSEYSPDTYHVNSTHSVYIRLDGSYLRISHPETNIQKRAMFNEPRHKVVFVHQRHYDITGAYVSLLPGGLSRTRLWSKKYPLCLTIPNSKQAILLDDCSSRMTEDNPYTVQSTKESPSKKFIPKINEKNEVVLYLFARTDREKDEWCRRLTQAAKAKMLGSSIPTSPSSISSTDYGSLENKRAVSIDLGSLQLSSSVGSDCSSEAESEVDSDLLTVSKKKKKLQFDNYLASLLSPSSSDFSHSVSVSSFKDKSEESDKSTKTSQNSGAQNLLWLNSFLGRLFFDFLTNDFWAKVVSERIQRKLSKIKVPYFIEELTVTEIDLGCALPKIHRASETIINEQGLWVDLDLSYSGCFQMTLETKLNLLRLQKSPSGELTLKVAAEEKLPTRTTTRSDLCNSEEDDSAESSSDEESLPEITEQATTEESSSPSAAGGSTSRKLLRFVDKIAQSPYFQHAAKNKYIKRAMEEVSNTPLVLTVEIQWFTGTLAINIPPLPTDRLWYGFRTNPNLSLVARPKLGGHAVKITHVTEWIEKKLISEFQKVLVMPNMGNIVIPIMHFNLPSQKS